MSHLRQFVEVQMYQIKDLFLFDGLTEEQCESAISYLSNSVKIKKGEVIYSAEHFPNALGVVLSGKAVAFTNNGSRLQMNSFESGCCFGAAALFNGDNSYVSTISAKTDVEILFITENELKALFTKYPVTSINYINFLTDKIRFLNKKLGVLSCSNTENTVYSYLSSVSDSDGYAIIPDKMTRLANMLGLSRASLYRGLDSLERDKKILRENNKIKVIKNEKNS